jgi:hypothetical protein
MVPRSVKTDLWSFRVSDCKGISTNFYIKLFFLHKSAVRPQVRVDEMVTNCEYSTWALTTAGRELAEETGP